MNENINLDDFVDGSLENEDDEVFLDGSQDHDGDNDTDITIDPSKDVRYSKLNEGEKLKYDCVICLELQIGKASSDKWVAIFPCHHTFHEECILQHIMFKNNKCCLCRMQFNCDHDQNKNDN